MANEPLTDETMARVERHFATERELRDASKAQRRQSDNTPPEGWQERHSPTEDVKVRYRQDGAKRVDLILCRRRMVDARLWDSLDPSLQDAAVAIERGFSLVTRGMGHKPQTFERRSSGKSGFSDWDAEAMAEYWAWALEAQRSRLDHAAIILVLIEGMSLSAVDTTRRKRKGYAKEQLIKGLNLFCRRQGWPVQPIEPEQAA